MAHADQGAPLEAVRGDEIDGIEVRWDIEETRPLPGRASLAAWDRLLAAGLRVGISSGGDSHQPDEWAGSSLRTVVLGAVLDDAALIDAVVAGRSYLSGTWHPDIYRDLGCPERANEMAGGTTRFTPWWESARVPGVGAGGEAAFVLRGFELALRGGRCRRADYPELVEFRVGGSTCGEEAETGVAVPVRAAWRTRAGRGRPRLVADGRVVYQGPGEAAEFECALDLRGFRSLRLEVEAADPADPARRDAIVTNPVWLRSR